MNWKRFFRRSDAISEAVERALELQAAFERAHPVPYAPDQRFAALRARADGVYGSRLPEKGVEMLRAVVADWVKAQRAAEEVE